MLPGDREAVNKGETALRSPARVIDKAIRRSYFLVTSGFRAPRTDFDKELAAWIFSRSAAISSGQKS